MTFIWLFLLRTFIPKRKWLFSDAKYSKTAPSISSHPSKEQRCITKVQTLSLSSSTVAKCLRACRENKTTFTSLLHTLIQITLVTDLYPDALFGLSAIAANSRPYVKLVDESPGKVNKIQNLSGAWFYKSWLGNYHKAGQVPIATDSAATIVAVQTDKFWALARSYRKELHGATSREGGKTPAFIQGQLGLSTMGEDIEEIASNFGSVGMVVQRSYLISNLGVFDPRRDGETMDPWTINDMDFSGSTIKPSLGYVLYFGAVSMARGGCKLSVTYEQGTLDEERVRMVMDGVRKRLEFLVELL